MTTSAPITRIGSPGLAWAALALAAVAPFAVTLAHGLVWDDHYIVRHAEALWRDGGLRALLSAPFFPHPGMPDDYYRPVVNFSVWLDMRIGRGLPGWLHLVNLLLHMGCTLLVWSLCRRLTRHEAGALAGGLLFALHPVHVEPIAWVSGRTDLLATLFTLLAALAWLDARRPERSPATRVAFTVVSAGAFLAALLSKENALLLPVLLLLTDAWMRDPREGGGLGWLRRNTAWISAYAAVVGMVVALRHLTLTRARLDAAPPLLVDDPWLAIAGLVRMLRMVVVPWAHHALYTRTHLEVDIVSIAAVGIVAALLGGTATRRFDRLGVLGGAWLCLFLAPALLVRGNSAILVAERYLYLPSVGFCLVAGRLLGEVAGRAASRSARHAAGVAAVACVAAGAVAYADFARATVWRSDLTLGADLVRTSPDSALAQNRLGQALLEARRYRDALAPLLRAVSLDPLNAGYHNDAGIAFRRLHQPAIAVEAFRESLRLEPGTVGTHLNLAYACLSLRDRPCVDEQRRSLAILDPRAREHLESVIREYGR